MLTYVRRLWSWFVTVDEDRSGQITATELQRALVNGNWSPFDLDTTKMLMGIFVSRALLSVPFALARTLTDLFWDVTGRRPQWLHQLQ